MDIKNGYDVHHLNQIKADNRLQNLVYLTHPEHSKLHSIGKAVYCVELNKVFASIKIAAKELSLYYGSISKCCQGKRKTAGGYHFQFV